jgi:hypothetical protein
MSRSGLREAFGGIEEGLGQSTELGVFARHLFGVRLMHDSRNEPVGIASSFRWDDSQLLGNELGLYKDKPRDNVRS